MRPEYYKDREQTYVKHFVLDHYLQRVAFHIGFARPDFVYVDCFSGPWRNNDNDEFADTSIRVALDKLNYVATSLADRQKRPRMRAVFVEENPRAFRALTAALQRHRGTIETIAFPGTFEDNIPKILDVIGKSFGFFFIDPKDGQDSTWTFSGPSSITNLGKSSSTSCLTSSAYDALLPPLLEERHITTHIPNDLILEGRQKLRLHVDFKSRQRVPNSINVISLIGERP